MSYTPPAGDALQFQFPADAYTPPAGDALAFSWAPPIVEAVGAAPSPLGAPAVLADVVVFVVLAHSAAPSPLAAPALYARRVDQARGAVPTPLQPGSVAGTVVRYELRGEVRNQGVLVDRRVRAYRRSDGALMAEQDTTAGRFRLHCGFAAAEHYLVPVDLSAEATDYAPPCANRVLSVLADDLA